MQTKTVSNVSVVNSRIALGSILHVVLNMCEAQREKLHKSHWNV